MKNQKYQKEELKQLAVLETEDEQPSTQELLRKLVKSITTALDEDFSMKAVHTIISEAFPASSSAPELKGRPREIVNLLYWIEEEIYS